MADTMITGGNVGERSNGQGPGASRTGSIHKTTRDMLLSVGLVLMVMLAVAVFALAPWRAQPDPVKEVNPYPVANLAIREANYKVLMPRVGDGWRATSARWSPTEKSADKAVWFNGWVSPDGDYYAVIQSPATHRAFIREHTADGDRVRQATDGSWPWSGSALIKKNWTPYLSADGETKSLVRVRNGHTTIVTTSADWSDLGRFQESLAGARKVVADRMAQPAG